jgi:hypothetical protein
MYLWDEPLPSEINNKDRRPGAVFTHVNNEDKFFPLWLKHYSQYFEAKDIYVLAHNSNEEFEDYLLEGVKNKKFNMIPVSNLSWFNTTWLCQNVSMFQWLLLQSYKTVTYTDVDELIFTDPESKWKDYREYYMNFEHDTAVVKGYHIASDPFRDPPIDLNKKITEQRTRYLYDPFLDKPLITSKHVQYNNGMHTTRNLSGPLENDLILFHLHYIDFDLIYAKDNSRTIENWCSEEIKAGFSIQNLPGDINAKKATFLAAFLKGRKIPEKYIGIL